MKSQSQRPLQDNQLPDIFTDSELYKVEIKKSQIQGAGIGLFATKTIHKGEFITEYYGAIIPEKLSFSEPFLMEDKMVYLNKKYCVISRSPASRPNDIVKWDPQYFFSEQNKENRQNSKLILIEGKSRNAQIRLVNKDKAFITAQRTIKPGQQIYIDYGFAYWQFFFQEQINSKNKDNLLD